MNAMVAAILAQAINPTGGYTLTTGGWITMLLSVGFVTGLLTWCIQRVVRHPNKVHAPLDADVDTGDVNGTNR